MDWRMKTAWDAALNFLYPAVCQICGRERAGAAEGYVGGQCWSALRFVTAPFCDRCGVPYQGDINHPFRCANCEGLDFGFRYARSAVVVTPLILQVIHRYKYNRALWFEPFLADLLERQAAPALGREQWDLIVPVPLHPRKEREREFNQAERLAQRLSQATRIPVNGRLLRRVAPTRTQTLLTRRERLANVRAAFAMRPGAALEGRRLVLIDDVMTTGATTGACAAVLRAAGAAEVCVWTVARGI